MFRVAGRHHASVHVHIRGGMAGLEEVITGALITGAPLHVVHINSSSVALTREMLQIIAEAQIARARHHDGSVPIRGRHDGNPVGELRRVGAVARRAFRHDRVAGDGRAADA